ncbi:MAG: hypothetical protein AAGD25_15280 [Cyanobacteria bacterium P01_F01_bin.150]
MNTDAKAVADIAENAYRYLDEHAITTFTTGDRQVSWEPDYATLTVVDLKTGKVTLSAVRDGDGWEDKGSNISPDMVGEFHRLATAPQRDQGHQGFEY